jgi:hypothetical protein
MSRKHKLAAGAAAIVTAAGAGGAVAATSGSTTNRKAFLDDAAGRLHVTPSQLQSALGGAYTDRLNAAVAAHKLTKAQAQKIESRVANGGTPWLHVGGQRGGRGRVALRQGLIREAASYVGLTPAQVRSERQAGKSLAQIAQARGKTASGLEAALTAAVKTRLDAAVKSGKLSSAAEEKLLAALPKRLTKVINRTA